MPAHLRDMTAARFPTVAAGILTAALAAAAKHARTENAFPVACRKRSENAAATEICIGMIHAAFKENWRKVAAVMNQLQIIAVREIGSSGKY